jgi:hypothetical protein
MKNLPLIGKRSLMKKKRILLFHLLLLFLPLLPLQKEQMKKI